MVLATKHRLNRVAAVCAWGFLLFGASAPAAQGAKLPRPTISISAQQLHWTPIAGATKFEVKTSVEGQRTQKSLTTANEAAATVVPGDTVQYSVACVEKRRCGVSNRLSVRWQSLKEFEERELAEKEAKERENKEKEEKAGNNCFNSPKSCRFPDFTTSGVQNCSLLPISGNVDLGAGETLSGKDVIGYVKVEGNNAKVVNSCVTKKGGFGDESIFIEKGVTGFKVENSTVKGENTEGHFVEEALTNDYSTGVATAVNVLLYNCGECLHGEWNVSNSYVMSNGGHNQTCGAGCVVHFEDIFYNGNGEGKITFEHDTLLNPEKQTAVLFGESNPCSTHLTLKGSLVAGGGYIMYPCAHATSKGTSSEVVEGNRFARCKTSAISDPAGGGGYVCSGGPDKFGYFPGGAWGQPGNAIQTAAYEPIGPNNVWDDNGEKVN